MRVNGEALQLHAVYKTRILYYKSRKNSYDKVITTIVPWYTRKNITCLFLLALLHMLDTLVTLRMVTNS